MSDRGELTNRPQHRWTSRVLSAGSLAAAAAMGLALLLSVSAGGGIGTPLGPLDATAVAMAGVAILLATPAVSLVATALELRAEQPRSALLALLVLGVLGVAVIVALA